MTVSGIPPGCTSLSLHRLESDSSWSEALEGNGSFSQMLSFTALGNNICNFQKLNALFHFIIDMLCSEM